jgi:hypothetical protein
LEERVTAKDRRRGAMTVRENMVGASKDLGVLLRPRHFRRRKKGPATRGRRSRRKGRYRRSVKPKKGTCTKFRPLQHEKDSSMV